MFGARGTNGNEHHIYGGTEIKFKNDLQYRGTTENCQRGSVASDLPETNYKAVLTLEILVFIIRTAMFKIKPRHLHSVQKYLRRHLTL